MFYVQKYHVAKKTTTVEKECHYKCPKTPGYREEKWKLVQGSVFIPNSCALGLSMCMPTQIAWSRHNKHTSLGPKLNFQYNVNHWSQNITTVQGIDKIGTNNYYSIYPMPFNQEIHYAIKPWLLLQLSLLTWLWIASALSPNNHGFPPKGGAHHSRLLSLFFLVFLVVCLQPPLCKPHQGH